MADNEILEGLKEQREEKPSYFWGYFVGIISVLNGLFILFHEGFLTERLDAYFLGINEDWFGVALALLGIIKVIGIVADLQKFRIFGIVGLSVVWGMLFVVALLFSFGIGYPSNAFITNGGMLVASLRVSYRGAVR